MSESAFQEHASGLLVPREHAKAREVWTKAEWKTLERATKLLESRNIQVFLRCNQPACQKDPMARVRRRDGGISLECHHKAREFQGSF